MADVSRKTVGLVGLYDDVDSLMRAAERVRDSDCRKWDCHTPFPVHGLDRAMGVRESPVPYVTITAGFIGLAAAIALTGGLSVWEYPIRVGGKALFSWQAFVPIFFELFVLFAALATMGSVVFFCGLGKWHSPLHDSNVMRDVMCDRFAIVLEIEEGGPPAERLREILTATGCKDIRPLEETVDEDDSII
jgi:membrane protein implicated in regulation of membrane protease activity